MSKNDMLGPLTRALVGVPAKMLGLVLDIANRLGSADGENFFNDLAKFVREWRKKVAGNVKEAKMFLRHLFTFNLGAVDGKNTYAIARKVFQGYLTPGFELFGIVFSGVAPETEINTLELVSDGQFTHFLGNTAEELEKHRLLGSQFLHLCKNHRDMLRDGARVNFVVLTRGDEPVAEDLSNVFVASVGFVLGGIVEGKLCTDLDHISHCLIWNGGVGHRVFFPLKPLFYKSA